MLEEIEMSEEKKIEALTSKDDAAKAAPVVVPAVAAPAVAVVAAAAPADVKPVESGEKK